MTRTPASATEKVLHWTVAAAVVTTGGFFSFPSPPPSATLTYIPAALPHAFSFGGIHVRSQPANTTPPRFTGPPRGARQDCRGTLGAPPKSRACDLRDGRIADARVVSRCGGHAGNAGSSAGNCPPAAPGTGAVRSSRCRDRTSPHMLSPRPRPDPISTAPPSRSSSSGCGRRSRRSSSA